MMSFEIPGMSCGHCVTAVTAALRTADPAAHVAIDLATHQVQVQSDAPRAVLVRHLTEAGYPPSAPTPPTATAAD